MGLLNLFRRKRDMEKKAHISAFFPFFLADAAFTTADFKNLSAEGHNKNVYGFKSINLVSMTVGMIPRLLFQVDSEGNRREILDHKLLDLLKRPNPTMGGAKFFEIVTAYLLLAGDSFVFRVGPSEGGFGVPRELWPIRPDFIKPIHGGPMQPVKGFRFKEGTPDQKIIPPELILNLKTFNPISDDGLSPVQVAGRSVDQNNESKRWNTALLQNFGRPSGAFTTEGTMTEDQFNEFRESLKENLEGFPNAGKPIILSGGMKWEQTSLSPVDMDWLEGQRLSAREIALAFGVPPELIGDSSNKTFSNYKEARKAFYEETVIPLAKWIIGEFNHWLVPLFGPDLQLELDLDAVPALQDDRDSVFKRANDSNFLTINEKRSMTGFDDITGGDVILVPLTVIPLGSTGSGHLEEEDEDKSILGKVKSLNMQREEHKAMYWKLFDLQRQRTAGRVAELMLDRLAKDFRDAARALKSAGSAEQGIALVESAVKQNREQWDRLYDSVYASVGNMFARAVFSNLKSNSDFETKVESAETIWLRTISQWVGDNAGLRIVGITDTTLRSIRRTLTDGIAGGLSIPNIARQIQERATDPITRRRAITIARTEVISASNLGSRAAAQATGLPLEREWISTRDSRTRGQSPKDETNHFSQHPVGLDGQKQRLDDPYIEPKTGQKLMFPGDTSLGASGGNVINCRCTEGFLVVGD